MTENNDLPLEFIKDILVGLDESKSGKLTRYQFEINPKIEIDNILKEKTQDRLS